MTARGAIDVHAHFLPDLAGFPVPRQLDALLTITTTDHLHYGSDYPFTPEFAVRAASRSAGGGRHTARRARPPPRQHGAALPGRCRTALSPTHRSRPASDDSRRSRPATDPNEDS